MVAPSRTIQVQTQHFEEARSHHRHPLYQHTMVRRLNSVGYIGNYNDLEPNVHNYNTRSKTTFNHPVTNLVAKMREMSFTAVNWANWLQYIRKSGHALLYRVQYISQRNMCAKLQVWMQPAKLLFVPKCVNLITKYGYCMHFWHCWLYIYIYIFSFLIFVSLFKSCSSSFVIFKLLYSTWCI